MKTADAITFDPIPEIDFTDILPEIDYSSLLPNITIDDLPVIAPIDIDDFGFNLADLFTEKETLCKIQKNQKQKKPSQKKL